MNALEASFLWWCLLHVLLAVSMSMFRVTGNFPGGPKMKKSERNSDDESESGAPPVDKGTLWFYKFSLAQLNTAEYSGVVLGLLLYILLAAKSRPEGLKRSSKIFAVGIAASRTLQVLFIFAAKSAHRFDLRKAVAVTAGYIFLFLLIADAAFSY